jgi:histidinol-phosphate aminotransferase
MDSGTMTASSVRRPAVTRECYAPIELYAPNRDPAGIDLSDNTNRWGIPPAAARTIREDMVERVTRYPDLYASSLKRALAAYVGVDPSMIVTGCGSDDVLDSAIRAFGEPGDRIAVPDPSFAMVPLFARMNALVPRAIPLTDRYDLSAAAVAGVEARITYICSPNNPTGTPIPRPTIEAVLASSDGVVIVDEAYAEFADDSVVDLTSASARLLVVRTMSKAFGLAGLRVGYAIGNPALVAEVEKSRGPYKVSGIAERAAIAALTEDADWVRAHVALVRTNRDRLSAEFRRRGIDPIPSAANFVLAPVRGAEEIARGMRDRGVAVRPFSQLRAVSPALRATGGSAIRVSIGPWGELEAALDAFDHARIEGREEDVPCV